MSLLLGAGLSVLGSVAGDCVCSARRKADQMTRIKGKESSLV